MEVLWSVWTGLLESQGNPGAESRARTSQLGNGECGFSELKGAYEHPVNLLHRDPTHLNPDWCRMPLCLLSLHLLHSQESNVLIPRKWYPTSKYNPPGSRKTCPYKAFLLEHELRMALVEPITSKMSMPFRLRYVHIHHNSQSFWKSGKRKKNPFFSPKINKNREEERREREVRMELWRRGREKKRRRPGARGSQGRNGEEPPSAPRCPAEQPPPSAPCCPPGKQLLYWAASSTVQRGVMSQRTRWVLWSILRNGAKSQKGGRRKKRESTILSLFDCKTSLRAQLAPRQSPWKTRRLAFLTAPVGLGSGQQLKAPRHTFREELWEVTVWGEHGLGKLRQGWARVPLWSFSKPGGP